MKPDGGSLIGNGSSGLGGGSFKAYDPAKNTLLEPTFTSADLARKVRDALDVDFQPQG